MRKVGQFLLTGAMLSAPFSFVSVDVARSEPALKLAQAQPTPEELKKRQQQGQPPRPQPPAPQPRPPAPPPPPPHPPAPPPHPPQAAPVQPPRQPQAAPVQQQQQQQQAPRQQHVVPAQPQPPHQPATAPVQQQPAPRQPQVAPAQPQPPRQPSAAPVQQQQQQQQQAPRQQQVLPGQPQPPRQPTAAPVQQPQPQQQQAPRQQQAVPRQPLPALPPPTAAQARPLQRTNGPAAIVPTTPQGQPIRSVTQLRTERHEQVVGDRTVITEGNRMIVRENNGQMLIRHDDVDRFRYGARDVKVERRGNDNVTTIVLPNGQRVVSVLDPNGRIVRRSRFLPDGREVVILAGAAVLGAALFIDLPPPVIRIPRERYIVDMETAPPNYVYDALVAPPVEEIDQRYTLDQVLDSPSVRDLMPSVDIDTISFETGSWEVGPEQVDRLAGIADGLNRAITANPREVFLIEGHTDAVGSDVDNLSLSDRRAETVALILSDKFGVPPENLVTQGYGKQYLRIPTDGPERRNRRVTVRRITPLMAQAQ